MKKIVVLVALALGLTLGAFARAEEGSGDNNNVASKPPPPPPPPPPSADTATGAPSFCAGGAAALPWEGGRCL